VWGVQRIMAFRFETPYLDLEIYRLLTILEASPALAKFDGAEPDKRKLEFLRKLGVPGDLPHRHEPCGYHPL
jgi:hypothetical protein